MCRMCRMPACRRSNGGGGTRRRVHSPERGSDAQDAGAPGPGRPRCPFFQTARLTVWAVCQTRATGFGRCARPATPQAIHELFTARGAARRPGDLADPTDRTDPTDQQRRGRGARFAAQVSRCQGLPADCRRRGSRARPGPARRACPAGRRLERAARAARGVVHQRVARGGGRAWHCRCLG